MTSEHQSTGDFPLQGLTNDYWSNDKEATATCLCGAVQMVVPIVKPGLVNTFVCHCSDCRNVSASMFATNFTSLDSHTRFTRGEDNLASFGQKTTTSSGKTMTNYWCKTCGTLMFRVGEIAPGTRFMRGGIIDDHSLHNTMLKPDVEIFTEHRAGWLQPVPDARQSVGMKDF